MKTLYAARKASREPASSPWLVLTAALAFVAAEAEPLSFFVSRHAGNAKSRTQRITIDLAARPIQFCRWLTIPSITNFINSNEISDYAVLISAARMGSCRILFLVVA